MLTFYFKPRVSAIYVEVSSYVINKLTNNLIMYALVVG